jgi:hypothetical protein
LNSSTHFFFVMYYLSYPQIRSQIDCSPLAMSTQSLLISGRVQVERQFDVPSSQSQVTISAPPNYCVVAVAPQCFECLIPQSIKSWYEVAYFMQFHLIARQITNLLKQFSTPSPNLAPKHEDNNCPSPVIPNRFFLQTSGAPWGEYSTGAEAV